MLLTTGGYYILVQGSAVAVKLSEHGILPRECHKVKEDTGTGTAGEKGHTCGNAHFVNCSKPEGGSHVWTM